MTLFSYTEDNQKNVLEAWEEIPKARLCAVHPPAVRQTRAQDPGNQSSMGGGSPDRREAFLPLCPLLLGGLGRLGVQATSLPMFLEAWLPLNKPGQICSTLARAIYSGKTILIFKMYLLFASFT